MSETASLLLEIGCEEIPARMIRGASEDLGRVVTGILERAGLPHGDWYAWGGPRRVAVFVDDVPSRQPDREETLTGPPASAAFDAQNQPTRAALGFARKYGVEPDQLRIIETKKGPYLGVQRSVVGLGLEEVLSAALADEVARMAFPKSMRWGAGTWRWVRPVHWVVALHGREVLDVELFGCRSGNRSRGHRFLAEHPAVISEPETYAATLNEAHVVADPAERKRRLDQGLAAEAQAHDGTLVEDRELQAEAAELVEWPAVVAGSFDPAFLDLPAELLVTTLRHHQKCFSIRDREGRLLPHFLAVSNNDQDPAGHIRRGNEWVVGGRLDDARFFWSEDRKFSLADHAKGLERVTFHARAGTFGDKSRRMESMAAEVAGRLGLDAEASSRASRAAGLAKADLVTGTVGEFPELQGRIGGLLLRAEGEPEEIAIAVYEHYRPEGPDDALPETRQGRVVSVVDKLDTLAQLVAAGETPTGSRDPFGLRRAASGIFRVVLEDAWPVSLCDLIEIAGQPAIGEFLRERMQNYLRDEGWTPNEIRAVLRGGDGVDEASTWALPDIAARGKAISTVRQREDFAHLADLTKRVDNILTKGASDFADAEARGGQAARFTETEPAANDLAEMIERHASEIRDLEQRGDYREIVGVLARFVDPVERFFDGVLVLDRENADSTLSRRDLLERLRGVLTRCFDLRELAGQADRR